MNLLAVLGDNVARLRKRSGLTQAALARGARIDLTYLGGIERGRRNPSLNVIGRLAGQFGVPAWRLLRPQNRRR